MERWRGGERATMAVMRAGGKGGKVGCLVGRTQDIPSKGPLGPLVRPAGVGVHTQRLGATVYNAFPRFPTQKKGGKVVRRCRPTHSLDLIPLW